VLGESDVGGGAAGVEEVSPWTDAKKAFNDVKVELFTREFIYYEVR
jgi:hypothetical protein